MAIQAGYDAFWRAYADPEGERPRDPFQARKARYRYLWHFHQNTAFEKLAEWGLYKNRYRLYRHIRPIYNPARKLADFYAGIIYPGVLTIDAQRLPDGIKPAIPFAEDTDRRLLVAVGQLWRWSNWQSNMGVMCRWGSVLGDVGVEIVDDVEAANVHFELVWPGLVKDLELDPMGNVKAYTLEYDVEEARENGRTDRYRYTKTVDGESIRTFRNGEPYAYNGQPAVQENPYGFVPFVWIKHTDLGSDHGEPALRNLGLWDEVNALASHAIDQIHILLATPPLITGEGIGPLAQNQTKRPATAELENPAQDRESVKLLKAAPGADIKYVNMSAGETLEHLDRMLAQIERLHPEITMFDKLREMTTVTGPAADRLFGDVEILVQAARANYDLQSVKLFQMGIAIAGWRMARGDWPTDNQRAVFNPFDLGSYLRGDLDMEIAPRPLIPLSRAEALELERLQVSLEADRSFLAAPNGPEGIAQRLRATGAGE